MWGMGSASSSEFAACASLRLARTLPCFRTAGRLWTSFHSSAGLFDRSRPRIFAGGNTQPGLGKAWSLAESTRESCHLAKNNDIQNDLNFPPSPSRPFQRRLLRARAQKGAFLFAGERANFGSTCNSCSVIRTCGELCSKHLFHLAQYPLPVMRCFIFYFVYVSLCFIIFVVTAVENCSREY